MTNSRPIYLDPPVNIERDRVLGSANAQMTLVEYGSYACRQCHAVHEVVAGLRTIFGDRMRYIFRHLPVDTADAQRAAEFVEYAAEATGNFWAVHEAVMESGTTFTASDAQRLAKQLNLPKSSETPTRIAQAKAALRVREDIESAERGGARVTPTFFINGRRYEGPWDESSLADAMRGSLGFRIQSAAMSFVRWGPSAGVLLLLMSVLAVAMTNSAVGSMFQSWWEISLGLQLDGRVFALSLLDWVNHGLLSIFFLVVGLEIKREFTIGHLSQARAAALPLIAAAGGIILPALLYVMVAPAELKAGAGIPIATDTAFAVALIVLLGNRVPIELRVFLTATVIIDDLVAIGVIALFYSGGLDMTYLAASLLVIALLVAINRWPVYHVLPYAVLGAILWFCFHEAGLHATLAGVILAVVTPTRPPANLRALMAQAATLVRAEARQAGETPMRRGPSESVLRSLDSIHDRMESPAGKLLRSAEPWSSYVVLPIFALANAGVVWSIDVFEGHERLMLGIGIGLVLGKPIGIVLAAWLATRFGIATKSDAYSWRQLCGAAALGGIGFTMSLFIAGEAFATPSDYAAAKIAIFLASCVAGVLGAVILYPRRSRKRRRRPESNSVWEQLRPMRWRRNREHARFEVEHKGGRS